MGVLKTKVRNGRIVINEPTDLPDGTELELVAADDGDDLDEAERKKLHASLRRGLADAKAGKTLPADEVITRLKRKR